MAQAGQGDGIGAGEARAAPAPGHARSLWRQHSFLLLWGGQTVSEMGSAVTQLALPLTAVLLLHASTFQVGLLTTAAYAAFALVALPAGALVDRYAKRRVMVWCDAARLVLIGSVPAAALAHVLSMGQLYGVAVTAGVCTVFFDVSYQSYLPALIDRSQLLDGNGKLAASQSFAQVAGPGIGGGLVGFVGAAKAMTADALSYAVSVATLLAIRGTERHGRESSDAGSLPVPAARGAVAAPAAAVTVPVPAGRRLRGEIGEGLSFVIRDPILRKVVACTGTANLFSAILTALEVIFLVRVLHVRPTLVGVVFALASVGGVLGGALSGKLAASIGSARIIWFSFLVFGLPALVGPLAEPGWRVVVFVVALFANSFSAVVYNVAQVSYRQSICPPELLGRLNAAVRWIVWGTLPLGGLLGGVLGTAVGVRPALWVAFVGEWAAGFWVYFSPLRRMRDVPAETCEG